MIDYKNPLPAIIQMMNDYAPFSVYGNSFPNNAPLPAVLVKTAGGLGFTRLLFLSRAETDVEAMEILIQASNIFERYGAESLVDLKASWIARENAPIASVDSDTGKPEAWIYLRLEHLENI